MGMGPMQPPGESPELQGLPRQAPAGDGPVLVPLDGSVLAERAVAWGARLAGRWGVPLLLVRAVAPEAPIMAPVPTSQEASAPPRERALAGEYLESLAVTLCARVPGLEVRTDVRVGDAAPALLAAEAAHRPALVAMSTHGRTGLARWVRGSVAEAVLRHGSAPVLLIRAAGSPAPAIAGAGLRVVVPLDGSDAALRAVPEAARLASPDGGEVVLVAVVDPEDERLRPDPGAARAAHALTWRATRLYLEGVVHRLRRGDIRARGLVLTARDVPRAIVEQAALEDGALIAMSTHGRGGLGRLLYGSVADRVSQIAPVPVLLVRRLPTQGEPTGTTAADPLPTGETRAPTAVDAAQRVLRCS